MKTFWRLGEYSSTSAHALISLHVIHHNSSVTTPYSAHHYTSLITCLPSHQQLFTRHFAYFASMLSVGAEIKYVFTSIYSIVTVPTTPSPSFLLSFSCTSILGMIKYSGSAFFIVSVIIANTNSNFPYATLTQSRCCFLLPLVSILLFGECFSSAMGNSHSVSSNTI